MALKEVQQPEVVQEEIVEVEKEEVEVKKKTHVDDDDETLLHSIPTTSPPYIVFGRDERKQIFYSLRDRTCCTRIVPEIQGMNCDACCNGWLVMCNYDSTQCFLLNPVSMEKIELPPMTMEIEIKLDTRRCVLASPPPNYLVVFFSRKDFFYSFCRPGDKKWIKQELQDTGSDWGWMIESVVSCNGKIYMSYAIGGWIGILDINAMMMCNNIQELPPPRKLVKMLPDEEVSDDDDDDCGGDHRENIIYTSYGSYLVESCGDVFMVILNHWKHSTNVHSLDTYRLKMTMETSKAAEEEITSMEWEMMDNLGNDRMFMLGYNTSFSICASKIGATKNKILFQQYYFPDNKLIVCDLEEYGYLSIEQPCPDEEDEDEDDDDDKEKEECRLDDDEWIQMKIREEFFNSPYWMFLD